MVNVSATYLFLVQLADTLPTLKPFLRDEKTAERRGGR